MGVPFKKIARKDPRKADAVAKFYPQLVTLGDNATLDDIAYVMKEKSSLTLGDIQSVLTNFVEAMITTLYSGQKKDYPPFGRHKKRTVYEQEHQTKVNHRCGTYDCRNRLRFRTGKRSGWHQRSHLYGEFVFRPRHEINLRHRRGSRAYRWRESLQYIPASLGW